MQHFIELYKTFHEIFKNSAGDSVFRETHRDSKNIECFEEWKNIRHILKFLIYFLVLLRVAYASLSETLDFSENIQLNFLEKRNCFFFPSLTWWLTVYFKPISNWVFSKLFLLRSFYPIFDEWKKRVDPCFRRQVISFFAHYREIKSSTHSSVSHMNRPVSRINCQWMCSVNCHTAWHRTPGTINLLSAWERTYRF